MTHLLKESKFKELTFILRREEIDFGSWIAGLRIFGTLHETWEIFMKREDYPPNTWVDEAKFSQKVFAPADWGIFAGGSVHLGSGTHAKLIVDLKSEIELTGSSYFAQASGSIIWSADGNSFFYASASWNGVTGFYPRRWFYKPFALRNNNFSSLASHRLNEKDVGKRL